MSRHNLFISNFSKEIKFFVKLFIFCFCVLLFCVHVMPQYSQGYCAALIDKVDRLKGIDEPKIVLLGNSNLTFGIQSDIIENEFGMPVVNMGLHANLGNVFHEEMARMNVCEGDIYVLCHASFNDDGTIMDPVVAWITLEDHWELYDILRLEDLIPMMRKYPVYLRKCLDLYVEGTGNQDTEDVYSRNAYNQYGDICFEHSESIYQFDAEVKPADISDITVKRINELAEWLSERGATLVVAGYPIGKGELTVDESEYVKFQQELEKKLVCPIISDYTDYMYEYDYFYNSRLHLNDAGAELRTRQLVDDIKEWLQKGGNL